jgi:hypothetical protein
MTADTARQARSLDSCPRAASERLCGRVEQSAVDRDGPRCVSHRGPCPSGASVADADLDCLDDQHQDGDQQIAPQRVHANGARTRPRGAFE